MQSDRWSCYRCGPDPRASYQECVSRPVNRNRVPELQPCQSSPSCRSHLPDGPYSLGPSGSSAGQALEAGRLLANWPGRSLLAAALSSADDCGAGVLVHAMDFPDFDLGEPRVAENGFELASGQRAGDAAGPLGYVGTGVLVHVF